MHPLNAAARASIAQGLSAMSVNPLRTALSTLGVVIGVAAVIATLALADGLERYARAQIEVETDVQSITVSSRTEEIRDGFAFPVHGVRAFTLRDAGELRQWLGQSAEVTMVASGRTVVAGPSAAPHAAVVTATLANYLDFGRKGLSAGRFFTDGEVSRNAPVLVLSHKLASELSPNGDAAAMVDRTVRVGGRPFTVVGVLPPYTGERTFQVVVPLRAARRALGGSAVAPVLVARAHALEAVERTAEEIRGWLAGREHDWARTVSVTSAAVRLEQAQSAMLILKLVLGALAGVSLIVGGVGIMNVLLASVAERTREIGVRKALGARRRDILLQFLAEAVAIAGVGSGVGTAFGFAAAALSAAVVRWEVPGARLYAAVTPGTVATAVLSAVTVGLAFGILPALRAARLSPVDAMRHD